MIPLLIENHDHDGVHWLVSFSDHNPEKDQCVELKNVEEAHKLIKLLNATSAVPEGRLPEVKRTEQGWAGHFICGDRCNFRRNTMLEYGEKKIIVSTVGLMQNRRGPEFVQDSEEPRFDTVGAFGRYYETMAFEAHKEGPYWHADVQKQVSFESPWSICADKLEDLPEEIDNTANDMHEKVVEEISNALAKIAKEGE